MNKEYYNKVYIPDIVKWGKITMLLGIITCFGPALVTDVCHRYPQSLQVQSHRSV